MNFSVPNTRTARDIHTHNREGETGNGRAIIQIVYKLKSRHFPELDIFQKLNQLLAHPPK